MVQLLIHFFLFLEHLAAREIDSQPGQGKRGALVVRAYCSERFDRTRVINLARA